MNIQTDGEIKKISTNVSEILIQTDNLEKINKSVDILKLSNDIENLPKLLSNSRKSSKSKIDCNLINKIPNIDQTFIKDKMKLAPIRNYKTFRRSNTEEQKNSNKTLDHMSSKYNS